MKGSVQLRRYLGARRAGATLQAAAAWAGLGLREAAFTDADDAKGLLDDIDIIDPAAAGCAVTNDGDLIMTDETDQTQLVELASDTLRGDVRDAMLSWFKSTPKPWSAMGEREQRDFAATVDAVATSIVKQACQIIAANERPVIVAQLKEYREKDGVEAKLKLASTGVNVAALHEACGREVLIVTSGYDEVAGEAGPVDIDADQPGIPGIGDEYDEAA